MADDKYVEKWPPVAGSYLVGDPNSQVAMVTLASELDDARLTKKAAMCGPSKTENIGIEKVVANIVSNSNIRYLVLCGSEVHGHISGASWLALYKNGAEDDGHIIGAPGAIPYVSNLPKEAIQRFRDQMVDVIDLINVEDMDQIEKSVDALPEQEPYEEDPMLVKLGGVGEEEVVGVVAHTAEVASIESRVRMIESEYKDLGKLQKITAGLVAGLYQGFVLGLVLTIVIFGIRRLLG
ncbi:tetrahydromethanopterin S-methyltransferase subunit A [Methanosarcinales archaeon]|nr:MAG: tetrahydromethanopterin S-methyltransferase subunit A [Methanosarcinales archaeon]